jgi:signal transduction histidine kinase/CheY-like chemotaxis protein/anti-sigma regulatory factor (Ser/Thr protein kinase)
LTSEIDLAHLRTLGELAVRLAACTDPAAVASAAVSALAELGFAAVYLAPANQPDAELRLAAAWPDGAAPDTVPATGISPAAFPAGEALVLPLTDGPERLGVLVTGPAPREFAGLVAAVVAAAVRNAATHEEEQRTIAALAELDRAKTDLFANASHELRTPLTLVSAPAEEALADTTEPLPPAQRERIRLVRRNAARLRRLLNNILDFTQVTSGGQRAAPVATELAGLTRAIAASFAPAVERGGLEFVVACPPLARPAYVDREMWERIVLNLLSNALKFTLGGTITLRLSGGDGDNVDGDNVNDVVMSVTDTGIGIPADQVPLLFRRFHRVRGAVGRTGEGAGIGLALVHELVALHGGTVSVTSAPGAGSTFEVRVPYGTGGTGGAAGTATHPAGWVREVHLAEALGWVATDLPEPATAPDGPPVLVVEDNADLRRYLEQLLRPQWPVRTAPDGLAALDAVRETRPALVLADVAMPRLDGLELLDTLRRDPATADVPVILLSAQAGVAATAEGLHAGADDYLVKPFSPVELLARVRSSIELARLRHHHSEREALQSRFAAALAGATDMREVLSVAVRELGTPWDARTVVVVSWGDGGKGRVIAPDEGRTWDSLPRHVLDVLDDLRRQTWPAVIARPAGLASGSVTGVGATVDVVGDDVAVCLELPGERAVSSADRNMLRALCGQLGLALSRARSFEQQRTVAVTLQRSILGPATLPTGFAARYEPAHSPLEVGGDWYDIVELADGGIGLVVGDCVGRGLAAATVMGQLRSACRALLLQHDDPAAALTALDGFAGLLDGAACTTVLCARLDPATGELRYSSAGHPPAILAGADGGHTLLDAATSVPLAVRIGRPRPEAVTHVAPGSTLLLYTDGLVERSGAPIDAGIATAARVVVDGRSAPPEALADRVLDASGHRGGDDDVVVLVYRHDTPSASRYARSFPADPAELSTARFALTSWLDAHGLDRDVTERAVLATGEAWTNAIEHGYRLDRTRTVHTTVRVAGSRLAITVADLGRWRPPGDPGDRGRGIPLMEGVCDGLSIDHGPAGTTVHLVIDLR